jgi:protein involved in polysaccharide export with SLBB domain
LALGLAALTAAKAQVASPMVTPPTSATSPIGAAEPSESNGGPIRLRPARPLAPDDRAGYTATAVQEPPYIPGEFERYVQSLAGTTVVVRRLGAELVTGAVERRLTESGLTDFRLSEPTPAFEHSPLVPADYVLGTGDEILITLWGSVDAELRLTVDRAGRISIPRVGTVQVSGLTYAELPALVQRRVAQVFRNFQSSVSLGQLRGIRVFVSGYAVKPGSYALTSLSTLVTALMRAGGPTAAGSLRNIELRRGRDVITRFDLYDLLLKGDRSADTLLQSGDVVHVGAVGTQVGFIGSVNKPAVLELKAGETIADAVRMVGGFSAVADRKRLAVERLEDRNAGRVVQVNLPADERATLAQGDVLRAFSAVAMALPSQRQNKRVKVEGEVARPAEYVLPEGSSLRDAVRAAGGFTSAAFVYASELSRESVRLTQQENYDRALRDLETDMARTSGSQRISTADDASAQGARAQATNRLIDRLRALRPTGRIVLQVPADASDLPDLALEDGDRLFVPARPTTVGVFGSVFNGASYLHLAGRSIDDYLRLAGGPTKGADESSVFVIRANGNVVSSRQSAGFFTRSGRIGEMPAEPGDTVFVPEEMDKTTFIQGAKDWTQILYQFGLGIAGIKAAVR